MAEKYITTKRVAINVKREDKSVMVELRKGIAFQWDEKQECYVVANGTNKEEKAITINESTFNSLKSVKALISPTLAKDLAAAKEGNCVQLEQKVIELASENNELKEENEELQTQLDEALLTIDAFTAGAQKDQEIINEFNENQDDDDMDEQEDLQIKAETAGVPAEPAPEVDVHEAQGAPTESKRKPRKATAK